MKRVLASQRAINVSVIAISNRIGPDVVEPGLETVNHCGVIGEVPCAIYVIDEWIKRPNVAITEI